MLQQLLQRYGGTGPRYTSYPTAPHFHDGFGEEAYVEALARPEGVPAADGTRPLALYVHLPFCRHLCAYCGCHALAGGRPARIQKYLDYLFREIDLVAETLQRQGDADRVVHVHWGGGTPTLLEPDQIEALMAHLRHRFAFAEEAECDLEADPRCLTTEHLAAARRAGFGRISFGVQTLDAQVQEAIGRIQPYAMVAEVTQKARRLGFQGVNFDLLYGLPHQTPATWEATLEGALTLRPDRFSVFGYAHVPHMKPNQRQIDDATLPIAAARLELFMRAVERLEERGYVWIGLDHFARKDSPLARALAEGRMRRDFQGYTTRPPARLVGLGTSSIGDLGGAYVQNEKGLRRYYKLLDEGRLPIVRGVALTPEDRLRRHVIHTLMCDLRLDVADVERRFGLSFDETFAGALAELAPMQDDGLVRLADGAIEVTRTGQPFLRRVVQPFDAYLGGRADAPRSPRAARPSSKPFTYSSTV